MKTWPPVKTNAQRFAARLAKASCLLLHLSEGTDASARNHFLALKTATGWAVAPSLAAIHCVALKRADFDVLATHGASMVWSPLSNLLLYGATARIRDARAAGVRMGLGADWSYSGSKNLLGELQIAKIASDVAGGGLSDRQLVAMATRDAAAILKWDKALGSLEPGKRADIVVLEGTGKDPYAAMLRATETAVRLVMIDGAARFGAPKLMKALGGVGEKLHVGDEARVLGLVDPTAEPAVAALSLAEARARLIDALARLPELARALMEKGGATAVQPLLRTAEAPVWYLALDELGTTGMDVRPRLKLAGRGAPTGPSRAALATADPLWKRLVPLKLDPLTVVEDPEFGKRLLGARNLPEDVREGIREVCGG